MSWRSIILGLLGAAALAALSYSNDLFMKNTFLSSSYFPISAVGVLVIGSLAIHPWLRKAAPRLALRRSEAAVAFGLMLISVYVPSRGLGHNFTNLLMLPWHYERTQPSWQGQDARLSDADILDAGALAAALDDASAPDAVRRLRPADFRPPAAGIAPDASQRAVLLRWLNAVIAAGELEPPADDPRPHVRAVRTVPPGERTDVQRARLTRAALESAFPGGIRPRRAGVLELAPPRMIADPSRDPDALDGFVTGLGGDEPLRLGRLPWAAWRRALWFWIPVILTMVMASIGLALVVHRQWTRHEHLPFPTMEFARSLLPEEDGRPSRLLRQRPFWVCLGVVAAIHLINYGHVWWPDTVIPINLRIEFYPLVEMLPELRDGWGWWTLFGPTIYFTLIGLAYFLANDVSFSLGIGPYLYCLISGVIAGYGVAMGGSRLHPHMETFLNSGAYAGLFFMLVYSGRHYFRAAFGRGIGLPMRESVEPHAIWGARAAMIGFVLMVVQIAAMGVAWPFAALYTFWLLLVPLVTSRMLAESGVFFINPRSYPCALLWGFFGVAALGRQPLLVMALFTVALLIHASLAVLPFAVSAFRVAEEANVKPGRVALGGGAAILVALAVMIPANLFVQYRHGAFAAGDSWTNQFVPRVAFDNTVFVTRQLEAQGALAASDDAAGLPARWRLMTPRRSSALVFGIAFALVVAFGFLRHRFARWPFHPVMFAMFAVWPSHHVGFSFLLGWLLKASVMKYGGARLYQSLKPAMLGLIAGEVLGALIPALVGMLYYAVTGTRAPTYSVLPG